MINLGSDAIRRSATALLEARRSGKRIPALPASALPATVEEAHAIQDELLTLLGEPIAGWKVSGTTPEKILRGAIVQSRMLSTPASISAKSMPLLGIEAEIAFRFDADIPPRQKEYSPSELREFVTALPAIEVVDTRFESYEGTPPLQRLSDFMSNGALVAGKLCAEWRRLDFTSIPIVLKCGDEILCRSNGGHPSKDPFLPALAFVNAMRKASGVQAGRIVTTGSYTGLNFVSPGKTVTVLFEGLEPVELSVKP
jgi:2-keto-4-pentenoate hydratase